MTDPECVQFLQWALPRLRLRWAGFRKVRKQVCRRLARRINELGLPAVSAYRAYLDTHPEEWTIVDAFCPITISRFYRDRATFQALERDVMPALATAALARGDPTFRCWSIGCASGEEPYTVAMLWMLRLRHRFPCRLQIIATDIDPETKDFGGRMLLSDGRVCLSCKGEFSEAGLRYGFSTDQQRREEEAVYGIRRGALGRAGPAVVSLNGILASVAVTEFLVELTGVRPAYLHLEYKGMMGIVARDIDLPDFDCYYCKTLRGMGRAADVERYVRDGWGERFLGNRL